MREAAYGTIGHSNHNGWSHTFKFNCVECDVGRVQFEAC